MSTDMSGTSCNEIQPNVLSQAIVPSPAAAKLHAALCIILGKSNFSQWVKFKISNNSSDWPAYRNQTEAAPNGRLGSTSRQFPEAGNENLLSQPGQSEMLTSDTREGLDDENLEQKLHNLKPSAVQVLDEVIGFDRQLSDQASRLPCDDQNQPIETNATPTIWSNRGTTILERSKGLFTVTRFKNTSWVTLMCPILFAIQPVDAAPSSPASYHTSNIDPLPIAFTVIASVILGVRFSRSAARNNGRIPLVPVVVLVFVILLSLFSVQISFDPLPIIIGICGVSSSACIDDYVRKKPVCPNCGKSHKGTCDQGGSSGNGE